MDDSVEAAVSLLSSEVTEVWEKVNEVQLTTDWPICGTNSPEEKALMEYDDKLHKAFQDARDAAQKKN